MSPTDVPSRPGPVGATPVWTRALLLLAVAVVAAYVVWTVPGVRPRPGFDKRFDWVLHGSGYLLVAVLAVVGTWQRRPVTAAWWCVVAAVVLRAAAFDVSLTAIGRGSPLPYPSYADAGWVLSGVLLALALVLRVRELSVRRTRLVALDAVATGLVALGVALNALAGPIRDLNPPGVPPGALTVNILYPVLDMVLLVVAGAMAVTGRSRLTGSDLALMGGVVAFVVVDTTYFVLLAEGLWRPGTLLASLSLVATAIIGAACVVSHAPALPRRRRTGDLPAADLASGVVVPAVLVGVISVALALSGLFIPAVPAAILCYLAGGVVAVARGVRTVRSVQEEAGRVVDVASLDVRMFQALVEASADLIALADADGRPLYINPGGRRLLHVPDGLDASTLHVRDLAPGPADDFEARWSALRRAGRWTGQAELVPIDGSARVPVEIDTFAVHGVTADGRPVFATIHRDITERLRTQEALRDLADQRARLLRRLVQAQEDERARIAADVHDDPVQALAAVDLRLGLLRRRLEAESSGFTDDVRTLQDIVAQAMGRLRDLLFDLETLPEGVSLSEAIEEAAGFVLDGTAVRAEVTGEPDLPLTEAERVVVHRVVKEALVNVRKHADASQVVVDLAGLDGTAVATVDDDGRGIRPEDEVDRPGHLGLASMRDRAAVAGATLEIGPRDEGGTRVRLSFPVSQWPPGA